MNPDTPRQLKAFRVRNGITQTDLARSLGCSLPTIQRWESGRTRFPAFLTPALKALELERAFEAFTAAVKGCLREEGRFVTRIRVTEPFARALLSWTAEDWKERFNGTLKTREVEALADACLSGGFERLALHPFAPGTRLEIVDADSIASPFLEVRKSLPPPARKQGLLGRLLRRESDPKR